MRNFYPCPRSRSDLPREVGPQIIYELILSRNQTPADLAVIKRKIAKKYKVPCPNNVSLLKTYHELVENKIIKKSSIIENLLRTRPIRSLSGIVNISVLTKPYPCPGKCLYCPTEKGIPKSYVSGEPAVERAKKLKYDPYLQVKKRLEMLEAEGHPTDKIELRIVGGTWSYYPKKYQTWFIKRCFEACNEANRGPTSPKFRGRSDLLKSQKTNELAKHRIVGLSVETRPDFINPMEIKWLRQLGVTMVELGAQSIYDDVLKLNQRGHGVQEIIESTKLLKNAGFKVLYQMMPNLPGSSPSRDLKMFKELFDDSRFRPDLLKIYPCALVKESPLYKWWKEKKYKPYTEKQLISLVKSIKKVIPRYVRIQRIARDIPSHSIVAGPAKISNLRQIVAGNCKCIRCREVKGNYDPGEMLHLFRQNYDASDGREIFLSFENKKRTKLYSLLRLRQCNENTSRYIIREIHTYGQLQPINYGGPASIVSPQHRGLGKKLVREAERIVYTEFNRSTKKEFGVHPVKSRRAGISSKTKLFNRVKKIAVISGVGVRDYWRKLGYKPKNTYMIKVIKN